MTTLNLLKILNHSANWNDIYNQLLEYDAPDKNHAIGKLFEDFCKHYFLTEPSVKNEYKNVWFFSEIPQKIKNKLNLGKIDHGIDLVLEGYDGSLSVVQCKFRNDQARNISWTKDNLANLFADGDKADYFIVFTNASGLDRHSLKKKTNQLKIVTLGNLLNISSLTINEIKNSIDGTPVKPAAFKEPREYQSKAIQEVIKGFDNSDRGQLILPCGAGKTLVSLWIKEALNSKHTLVLVPSLALLRQIKNEWAVNNKRFTPYICVCSEKDIDKGKDRAIVHAYEITGKVSTNSDEIWNFLNTHQESIIYSTYQSLKAVCEAVKGTGFMFDLAICDEAHKTSGSKLSKFGLIHADSNIPVKKRLYMTATPRVLSDDLKKELSDEVINYLHDMDNHRIFGAEFYRMSFKEAIDKQILVDYQIVAIGVDDYELEQAIKKRRYVSDNETIDEIANNYALEKFMRKYSATHAITFHSSVKKAKAFQERHHEMCQAVDTYHVNGELSINERSIRMKEFERSPKSIITNARCLTEGVDVPTIDIVYFCDPKNSKIDIVQATGRALRRADYKGKKLGYVVVPIFHRKVEKLEETIESGAFKNLIEIIKALCSHDERLVDEIRKIKIGLGKKEPSAQHVSIEYSQELITLFGFNELLRKSLFTQVINKIRIQWRNFIDAKTFARSLGINGEQAWRLYTKSQDKPEDIPSKPDRVYKGIGWTSWGDWLGNGKIAPGKMRYRTFYEARKYIHTLNIKNYSSWKKYAKSNERPKDIPFNPDKTYRESGWISMDDWLGNPDSKKLPFSEARNFARSLGLKSLQEWRLYCKNGQLPKNIPVAPHQTYKKMGWLTYGDWLGNSVVAPQKRKYRELVDARSYVHTLKIKNTGAWRKYCKYGKKPEDIPANPHVVYKDCGWVSFGDWLGSGVDASKKTNTPFLDARNYVQKLNLRSNKEWLDYCNSGKKPSHIPRNPYRTYRDDGWISMEDWLGILSSKKLPFSEARKFARSLNLKSDKEWKIFSKSGNRPRNIPSNPDKHYKNEGWASMEDWLGSYGNPEKITAFMAFEKARLFVHNLKLKNGAEWRMYCKYGTKPDDIPANPGHFYRDQGWKSMKDWLGVIYRPFENARKFVHDLKLADQITWLAYCKSGSRPKDIPSNPHTVYKSEGWKSMRDWLGTGKIANRNKKYQSFEEAREYVHTLCLKSGTEWRLYIKSGSKPEEIPADPYRVYKDQGWKSWGDWLGTGTIAPYDKIYRPFEEARKFVHNLKLPSQSVWQTYSKSGDKPDDIPADPRRVYKTRGWKSMGDWLGTGRVAPQNIVYRLFEDARKFSHSLKLKSQSEWTEYAKSGTKPSDIPSRPNKAYRNHGWISWGNWLGTNSIATFNKQFLPFEDARHFVHGLKLTLGTEWKEYCKSGEKPDYIPKAPALTYKNKGWISWGDWLGTNRLADRDKIFRSFSDAREFVHQLKIKTWSDWNVYIKSGNKPDDIPVHPERTYKNLGWISMEDWLGNESYSPRNITYQHFEEARNFVRNLKLKSGAEWRTYIKSGDKPNDIPGDPRRVYKDSGWKSMGDWLGTYIIATYNIQYRSFYEAQKFIHSLNLKGETDWKLYCKSGKKPDDIPANPQRVYKNKGWTSWGDWFGTGTIAPYKMSYLSFASARKFVHSLKLKSGSGWRVYIKSGIKPKDIPADPRNVYKNKGWISMSDWLGNSQISPRYMIYRSFKQAKQFAHNLNLKRKIDWEQYCKKDIKPNDIPSNPQHVYKHKGWISWGNWLGTTKINSN